MPRHSKSNIPLYILTVLACLLILAGSSYAQTGVQAGAPTEAPSTAPNIDTPPPVDLAKTGILDDISTQTFVYFSDTQYISPATLPALPITICGTKNYGHFIPASHVNKLLVLKFTMVNSSDSGKRVFFCPGFFFNSIRLFKMGSQPGDPVLAMTAQMPDDPDSLGYRGINLQPHEKATFFAMLTFIRSATNSINPTLTRESFIRQGITINHKSRTNIDIITNLFAGIMLMMIFYATSEYIQTRKREFLFYIGYSLFISALLFLKSILHNTATSFNFFFESFLDNIIFCVGHLFYILFHRKFLDTKKNYPDLDRILHWGAIVITGLMLSYTIFFFAASDFRIANDIENATKIMLLVILLIFIVKGLGYRNQLMTYIIMGNISLFLLSVISQLMVLGIFKPVNGISVLNLALFYYEAGITIEVLFFLFALTYKNKMEIIYSIQKEEKLKLETERKELEKHIAVLAAKQDERNRISVDMHDELGSGVTAIRLMSEIVKSKMKEQTLPEIDKISNSANDLLNKMNTIIWTMTSSNDTVENLVAYIRSYAVEFFENTPIDCYFSMPAIIPNREISGERRRNIFLSVKESLNNVLKHAQCTIVKINVLVTDKLTIEIQDDGVGINMDKLRKFGNGLHNMKKRMDSIDGTFSIENLNGTRTLLTLEL